MNSFNIDDFISINITITYRCMFECKMCNMWELQKDKNNLEELSIDEWKNFIMGLRKSTNRMFLINFAGGEPLMKNNILDLVNFCASQKFNTYIGTNAFLIDINLAKDIINSRLSTIGISLESLDENVHNLLRGRDSAYSKAMEAIDNLGRFNNGLRIVISAIIMGKNLDSIIPLAKWAESDDRLSGITFQAIMRPFSAPLDADWRTKEQYGFLWPGDPQKTCRIIDELIEMKKNGMNKILNPISQLHSFKDYFKNPKTSNKDKKCRLTGRAIEIEPRGTVKLCVEMDPIGNVREDNLEKILSNDKALDIAKNMKCCAKRCHFLVNCFYDEN